MMTPLRSYFHHEIAPIFDDLLSSLGAVKIPCAEELTVRYEGAGWFVECFALASDGPKYGPRVAVGPLPEIGILYRDKQVDILHMLPPED